MPNKTKTCYNNFFANTPKASRVVGFLLVLGKAVLVYCNYICRAAAL